MAATILNIDSIISDPKIRNGRPVIAGTTLRISDVAAWHNFGGLAAEDLAQHFQLPLGQIHAALAYYFLNKQDIDAEIRANADVAEAALAELAQQGRLIRFD